MKKNKSQNNNPDAGLKPSIKALQEDVYAGTEGKALPDGQTIPTKTKSTHIVTLTKGNLERVDNFILTGWATDARGEPAELQVRIDGKAIKCKFVRSHRQDVVGALGTSNPYVGFEIELPGTLWGGLPEQGCLLELLANEQSLTSEPIKLTAAGVISWVSAIIQLEESPKKQALLLLAREHIRHGELWPLLSLSDDKFMRRYASEQLEAERPSEAAVEVKTGTNKTKSIVQSVQQKSYFEVFDKFTLSGWAVNNNNAATDFQIRINRKTFECNVVRSERWDVVDALGISDLNVGFSIELPGYVWELLPENGGKIEILANNKLLTSKPLELTRETAIKWISEISWMEESQEKQYLALLALEHVHYGRFLNELNEQDARFIRDFAGRMKLDDFIRGGVKLTQSEEAKDEVEAPAESMSTLLLWKALRMLNRRLTDTKASVFNEVLAVMQEFWLQGEARVQFLFSVAPSLCNSGEFLRLHELIDSKHFQQLSNSDNLWEMTLALPSIVADGSINRATDVVYRIAKSLDKGWLNSECIYFSIQLLHQMEVDGKIELTVAEKYRYAVIALLDSFKGEWFSRLHDQKLIESMMLMLSNIDCYTDYHRSDVVNAAQRIYGLNPAFWEGAAAMKLLGLDSELARSHAHFGRLHGAFSIERPPLAEWLEEIAEPLAYFRAKNNPEAVIFLREICANILPSLNESTPARAKALLAKLLASDPAEALRVAAFPLSDANRLLELLPETTPEKLRETLHNLSDSAESVTRHLQENASAALQTLLDADPADHESMEVALVETERRSIALANSQGGFLAFDLLASCYLVASMAGVECSSRLTRLQWVFLKSLEGTNENLFLPAPVMAGLFRLGSVSNKVDPLLRGFLAECRSLIHAKFGEKMDDLFVLPKQPKLCTTSNGWPRDTLVVIYSCRKYLNTRVKAIRETWIQDLVKRGIPYLVLVGDGDDTITGDVLALDVSDKYEDLPKKTLKLFDWVYHNTNAQYVLKIDDDCLLNVPNFFDTLSYRKHFYYGRVISRDVGSMDREWHQSKSHSLNSQKTIDKSPEPSVYADGGGGYTLSRLAMKQLLKIESSAQGERLKGCSFMEDKLVGDLLAIGGIQPVNEDYESYQRRRTFGEAIPVGMWENTFFPGRSTPTKVTHLDNHLDLASARDKAGSAELWPKKLWPTCWSPDIKLNTNQLELLTDTGAAIKLLGQELLVISVVRNEIVVLPHFLAHYRKLGVKCFVFVDNCSDDGTREYLFKQPDVILYSADTEYKHSHFGVVWQQAVLGNLCLGKWVLLVDADEFFIYENSEKRAIGKFIADIKAEGCDAARTVMVDMYPAGDLSEADLKKHAPFETARWFDNPPVTPWRLGSGFFSNSASYSSHLRHRVVPNAVPHDFVSQKYPLFRYTPWVRLSEGLHYASNLKVSCQPSWFAHFKYHAGLKEKVETEIRRGQHFNNAEEYRRYAAMLAEGQGGFGRKEVSMKYENSKSFNGLW